MCEEQTTHIQEALSSPLSHPLLRGGHPLQQAASLAQSHLCCSTSRSAPKSSPSTVGCPKLDFPPNSPQRVSGGFSHVFATESACECSLVHVNGKEEEELEEEMVLFRGVFCVLCLEICKLERDVGGREGMQGISPRLTLLLIHQDS